MTQSLRCAGLVLATCLAPTLPLTEALAASHREAPVTAIDRTADITDWYAFVSPDAPNTVTMILAVDPLLEPGNGPNYFPFDENLLYEFNVDNDQDAREDIVFQVRFRTKQRLPQVPVGYIGAGGRINAPSNSPPPIAPGTPLIPPAITALDGPGSEGLGLRQTYIVTMLDLDRGEKTDLSAGSGTRLFAVPSNVGPRTMPNYRDLVEQGIYELDHGILVFAGTTDDAFYIDLGAAFDSLNFRVIPGPTSTGIPAVLSDQQDGADLRFVADEVAGYNVNTIALQVPISLLTRRGDQPSAESRDATIGTYGSTSRRQLEVRQPKKPIKGKGEFVQVQRMGNPLFNELIIGTGFKDLWSRSAPKEDRQFADFALDPLIARAAQAAFGGAFDIPAPPRNDLLPLVTYAPPIAAAGSKAGPIADLLRLNVGVPPTPFGEASRLGVLDGDAAGFPNGRRPLDDVTDIVLRVVVGGVLVDGFDVFPNNRLGDGVNIDDMPIRDAFPYVGPAQDGRNSRHIDPGEPGCATLAGNAKCPIG
jgi:Domain of unknown function (DUF4331)